MTYKQLRRVSAVFSEMQLLRTELLRNPRDHTAMLMGQMLEKGKDAMKGDFTKLTTTAKFR